MREPKRGRDHCHGVAQLVFVAVSNHRFERLMSAIHFNRPHFVCSPENLIASSAAVCSRIEICLPTKTLILRARQFQNSRARSFPFI